MNSKQIKESGTDSMKAEDMFLELGYECKYSRQRISYAKTVYRTTTLIVFDLKTKQAYCECGMAFKTPNKEEKKAIQKQKEELGWLESSKPLLKTVE